MFHIDPPLNTIAGHRWHMLRTEAFHEPNRDWRVSQLPPLEHESTVLSGVNALRCASTARSTRPSGIDRACAQRAGSPTT